MFRVVVFLAITILTGLALRFSVRSARLAIGFGLLGLVTVAIGGYLGLVVAPPERDMGDVYRILYVHVPAAWVGLLCVCLNFGACVAYLFKADWGADSFAEATAEVGLCFSTIAIVLGSIWAKPTWGVYWTWDPRLTTYAIMIVSYSAYLVLRGFIDDPERRAVWSSVVGIIAGVDIPIVYFSVNWWNTLHQQQSSPQTVSKPMVLPLDVSGFAFLFVMICFIALRHRIARARRAEEIAPPEALPSTSREAA